MSFLLVREVTIFLFFIFLSLFLLLIYHAKKKKVLCVKYSCELLLSAMERERECMITIFTGNTYIYTYIYMYVYIYKSNLKYLQNPSPPSTRPLLNNVCTFWIYQKVMPNAPPFDLIFKHCTDS